MRDQIKNLLLALLALVMLAGFALAVPSPELTEETRQTYLDEGPADADDEYAFLFE